jgi:hypothetical protein
MPRARQRLVVVAGVLVAAAIVLVAVVLLSGGDDGGEGDRAGSSAPGGAKPGDDGTPPEEEGPGPGPKLRWPPPTLSDPTRVTVADGYTIVGMKPSRDYIVELPPTPKRGALVLKGGHNVVVEGGSVVVPADGTEDAELTGIYVKGATGTVHIEGVHISAEGVGDGFVINAPEAVVQIENSRVDGISGSFTGYHADVLQPWGGVRDLRVDRLTGTSDYQGLQIPTALGTIGSATISHANMRYAGGPQGGGVLIWLTKGDDTCDAYPVTLSQVYVNPKPGRSFEQSIWPAPTSGLGCAASVSGNVASWPNLPVAGVVRHGVPEGGDFVPRGLAGVGYSSPGY